MRPPAQAGARPGGGGSWKMAEEEPTVREGTRRGCWPGRPGSGNLVSQPPLPPTPAFSALTSEFVGTSATVRR